MVLKRVGLPVLTGILLTIFFMSLQVPYEGIVFTQLIELRGKIPASNDIVIATFEHAPKNQPWEKIFNNFLVELQKENSRAVHFDFQAHIPAHLYKTLKIYQAMPSTDSEKSDQILPLVSSPRFLKRPENKSIPDPLLAQLIHEDFLKDISPTVYTEMKNGPPRLLNMMGPPGTFPRIPIVDWLKNKNFSFQNKIVLISQPPTEPHTRFGFLSFFPRGFTTGWVDTEIHANIIENVLYDKAFKLAPHWTTWALTGLVCFVTVYLLFFGTPLLVILSILFLISSLVFIALVGISSHIYFNIYKALVAIFISYYFLIPYRLIVEYRKRWKFQEQNRILAEVEMLKDNFMSLVSHNLKTPIARIEGIVETLQNSKDFPSHCRTELSRVLDSTSDLTRFVGKILNLTKVEQPEFQIHAATKDLNSIVEKVVMNHQALAKAKSIVIKIKLEPLFPLKLDEELIQESIANLVENAIKYTPEGGQVEIQTRESGNFAEVLISDNGPGIHTQDQDQLFSKFYRGHEVKNKGIRGSGLGLYLVKYFIELHKGKVSFENRPLGGTTFKVELPRA